MKSPTSISVFARIILVLVLINVIVLREALNSSNGYYALYITLPLLLLVIANNTQWKLLKLHNTFFARYMKNLLKIFRPKTRQGYFETYKERQPVMRQQRVVMNESERNDSDDFSYSKQARSKTAAL